MADVFAKINPTDPLRLDTEASRRKRNGSDVSDHESERILHGEYKKIVDDGCLQKFRVPSGSGAPSERFSLRIVLQRP
jgi:hypothetical protein